jgi:HflK protein
MDPLMAFYRPFGSIISAVTTGLAAEFWGDPRRKKVSGEASPASGETSPPPSENAHDAHEPAEHGGTHSHDAIAAEEAREREVAGLPFVDKLRLGFRSAFVEIFDETSHWMLAGLVISALITAALPAEFVTRYLSSGPLPLFFMLLAGIPLYICASASTPIAAALMLKGLSPGAAFVFLLAGPATNAGSIGILARLFGRRVLTIFLVSVAVTTLVLGALLDLLYPLLGIEPRAIAGVAKGLPQWLEVTSALGFCLLLAFSFRRASPPREFRALWRGLEWVFGFRLKARFLGGVALAALAAWGLSACVLIVPPGSSGLLRRFGAPVGGVRGEGLHFKLPPPFETATLVPTGGLQRIEIGFRSPGEPVLPADPNATDAARALEEESVYLTGDENLIDVKSVLHYRIMDAEKYVYSFRDANETLKVEALSELSNVLASVPIDGVYTDQRQAVEAHVLEGLERRVAELDLGIEVVRFAVRDVHAPAEVHAAFRDVASAHEDKQTAINVAYRYLDETVNLARGEAAREVAGAKGYSVSQVRRAEGDSASLLLRSNAYRGRREATRTRLYLETMEEVLAKAKKVVRPGWGASGNVDLWISTGEGSVVPVEDVVRGSEVRGSKGEDATKESEAKRE